MLVLHGFCKSVTLAGVQTRAPRNKRFGLKIIRRSDFRHDTDTYMYACIHRYQMSGPRCEDPADAGWRLGAMLTRDARLRRHDRGGGRSRCAVHDHAVRGPGQPARALPLTEAWSAEHRGMLELRATEVAIGEVVAQLGL